MPNESPDLRFGPGTNQGFTGVGVATFDDLQPAAVVRELIQNAQDAARAAKVTPAVVRFRLSDTDLDSIPGMASYREAFEKAILTQQQWSSNGELAEQAKIAVDRIRNALERDDLEVLTVFDNGVGLNQQRMDALLSDGLSVKDGAATGTYGNGHATAIPASDLRYLLYAGLTKEGSKIGAGHAVLASYIEEGENHPSAGDGFYIRGFKAGQGMLYEYATGNTLPQKIKDVIDEIENSTGHGSAVIIPAFNNFLEEKHTLWDMIQHAASANFFIAIEDGELEIEFEDFREGGDKKKHILNKSTLQKALEKYRERKRAKAFLSGHHAYEAYKAYQSGVQHQIQTAVGVIEIRLKSASTGAPRVDLCRNGMWITYDKKIPGFSQKFAEKVPFQAILSLNAEDGGELHDLVRTAEGPLHNTISLKHLPKPKQNACRDALIEIVNWILGNTESAKSKSFFADDFLALDFGVQGEKGSGKKRRVFQGVPVPVNRNPSRQLLLYGIDPSDAGGLAPSSKTNSGPHKGSNAKSKSERTRPSLPTFFRAVSRPAGKNRFLILIDCLSNYADAELRLVVDEAIDATCERPGQDTYTPAVLSNVTINGKVASEDRFTRWDDEIIGVRLGDLKANTSTDIETDYRLVGDFENIPTPSFRVEVLKCE